MGNRVDRQTIFGEHCFGRRSSEEIERNMDNNLKTGGKSNSVSDSIVLPGKKLATSKTPLMLTPSEIALLRLDLQEAIKHTSRKTRA